MPAPRVDVPDGWAPLDPFPAPVPPRSFVAEDPEGDRLRVAYFRRPDRTDVLRARAWFGPGSQGPPGFAHGGAVAAVLDEALGATAWLAGHPVVVARLEVDMRAMIPLGTDAEIESSIVSIDGRKITCRARLTGGDVVFAESEALCIVLSPERLAEFRERIG